LFAANRNGKRTFVFLSRQMINENRRLLFHQTWPSKFKGNRNFTIVPVPTKRKPCTAAVQCTQPSVMGKVSKSALGFLSMSSFLYGYSLLHLLMIGLNTSVDEGGGGTRLSQTWCLRFLFHFKIYLHTPSQPDIESIIAL
jgi:hypothetical protein